MIFLQSKGLKSLLQHHSSKASILWHSVFLIVQLSHPYMTTGKTKALTRWSFVGKVMSLLLNMLSRFVIVFLPRNKCLLISWLQSSSAVNLEYQSTVFIMTQEKPISIDDTELVDIFWPEVLMTPRFTFPLLDLSSALGEAKSMVGLSADFLGSVQVLLLMACPPELYIQFPHL